MRQFNKFKGTKGFITIWQRVIRFRYMITETAKERVKILAFWEKYGTQATKEAFGVSRPTLFRWQKALEDSLGKIDALNKKSTAPKTRRKRITPKEIEDFIVNERQYDPQLSKNKLAELLREDKVANLSASTVGRMLLDLKKQGKLPSYTKLSFQAKTGRLTEPGIKQYRVKLRSKRHEGALVKADTIVRFKDGLKRYIVTALDTEKKFGFAYAYKSHTSAAATDFMEKFKQVAPLELEAVQTDNGSGFERHFHIYLEKNGIIHFNTHPRSPKENSEIERFNRTLSDAFIKRNLHLLAHDIDLFNEKLIDWLLWYNTRRPHWSLGLISPLRYICNQLTAEKSQMCWTSTSS